MSHKLVDNLLAELEQVRHNLAIAELNDKGSIREIGRLNWRILDLETENRTLREALEIAKKFISSHYNYAEAIATHDKIRDTLIEVSHR